jgi:hypothetical protein
MKVVTAVVNNPTFIEMQYFSLKKFMPCEYEYIVFNDAKDFADFTNGGDTTVRKQIQDICNKYKILCINIPNSHHEEIVVPSHRTAQSMNFIKQFQTQYPDEYLLLDSDMFLISPINIEKFRMYHAAVVLQHRNCGVDIYYLWNGIYYMNVHEMTDFDIFYWNMIPGCDTGGLTFVWLKKFLENNPEETLNDNSNLKNKIYYIQHHSSGSWNEKNAPECVKQDKKLLNFLKNDARKTNENFYAELFEDCVLHYRAGGNWVGEGKEFHDNLTKKLKDVLIPTYKKNNNIVNHPK